MVVPWRRREAQIAWALAGLAAARVLVFSLAFPFFTNVDEHRHVDAVLKYARAGPPGPGEDAYEPELAEWLAMYGSPEFHAAPGSEVRAPAWRESLPAQQQRVDTQRRYLARRHNIEAYESPAYYGTAGAWLRLARWSGLDGVRLLYAVRALNAVAFGLLCIVAFYGLRALTPEQGFLRLGVLVLLAVFPQDALYYVTRDALSPTLAGSAFVALSLWVARSDAGWRWALLTGAAVAAAVLVKYTNLPVVAVAAVCSVLRLRAAGESRRGVDVRHQTASVLLLWACALIPVALWLARNAWLFGDWSGSGLKVERMGWASRPPSQWLEHPIFTPAGWLVFADGLVPKFWRGELAWHQDVMATRAADLFYQLATFACLVAAGLGLRDRERPRAARRLDALAWISVAGSVALLAALSVPWTFHETSNPSAAHPYFDHGRLVAGALLPFCVLYLRGIEILANRVPEPARRMARWTGLGLTVGVIAVSELGLTAPVFASAYNAFHLP